MFRLITTFLLDSGLQFWFHTTRFKHTSKVTTWHYNIRYYVCVLVCMCIYVTYSCILESDEKPSLSTNSCGCKTRCATKKCPCKLASMPCKVDCHSGRTCANKPIAKLDAQEVVIVVDEGSDVPNLWVTIGQTMLCMDDKNTVLENGWLTDNIVFAAEQLLYQQHPYISGLQDPCLQLTRTFDVQGSREFIQCLNMSGNHWITISSVGCDADTIKVYDSMNLGLTSTLKTTVADLIHTSSKSFSILYMNMQYQIGGNDCGLIAIASACSICNGQDPSALKFIQDAMRPHLVDAFLKKKLMPFPTKLTRRGKATVQHSEKVSIYCVCRLPDNGSRMVECCKCKEWYHTPCVKIPKTVINSHKPWNCGRCRHMSKVQ